MVEHLECLYLLVAGDCNLSCTYCYADGGGYGRRAQSMSADTMKAALRRLLPRDGQVMVSFFGGEPLMNFGLIQETVAFGQALGREIGTDIRFAMTTNGTLLNADRAAFIGRHFSHVTVSLDGDGAATNRNRRFVAEGADVYGEIVRGLALLSQAGVPYSLRATIAEDCAHGVEASVRHLAGLGAAGWRVEPASGTKPWQRDNWRAWSDGMGRLEADSRQAFLDGRPMLVAGGLHQATMFRLRGHRRHHPCMAGQRMLAVDTRGDVYPCHQFVAVESACMGSVLRDEFPNDRFREISEQLEHNGVDARRRCSRCSVRYVCGGECPLHCFQSAGDVSEPSVHHCGFKVATIRETLRFVDGLLAHPAGRTKIETLLPMGS